MDLSFVSISDPIIKELNIYDLPLLVSYQNVEEIDRIQGVSTMAQDEPLNIQEQVQPLGRVEY